jgi:hypothetical protein
MVQKLIVTQYRMMCFIGRVRETHTGVKNLLSIYRTNHWEHIGMMIRMVFMTLVNGDFPLIDIRGCEPDNISEAKELDT